MPLSGIFQDTRSRPLPTHGTPSRPLRVTRFGKPIADIVPAAPEKPAGDWLGSLRGTLKIRGDIVAPSSDLVKWEALE